MLRAGAFGVALSTCPWGFEKKGEPKGVGVIPPFTTPDMDQFAARLNENGIGWLDGRAPWRHGLRAGQPCKKNRGPPCEWTDRGTGLSVRDQIPRAITIAFGRPPTSTRTRCPRTGGTSHATDASCAGSLSTGVLVMVSAARQHLHRSRHDSWDQLDLFGNMRDRQLRVPGRWDGLQGCLLVLRVLQG